MTIIKLLKTSLFVGTIYGWMVPSILLGEVIQDLFPTAKLNSQDWVIEAGEANQSFDFLTIDGLDTTKELEDDALEDQTDQQKAPKTTPRSQKQTSPEQMSTESIGDQDEESLSDGPHDPLPELTVKAPSGISKPFSKHPFKNSQLSTTNKTTRKQTARRGKCTAENPDIQRVGSLRYTVPKKVIKHYSTHWNEANRLAHLTWVSQPNGERSGIRIKGISCRSPLRHTGLRHGDVVLSVNGMGVDTERALLKIYGRLMFWKKNERRGPKRFKTITLQYDIV